MNKVYLSLGSNLGDRKANLKRAYKLLGATVVSKIYETEPFGVLNQPDFLNMACMIETTLSPREVLNKCKEIEREIGRQKRDKWGPREIDIDIIFYGDRIIDEPDLQIPHEGIEERFFVLAPMNDIAPDFVHPGNNITVSEMFESLV